MSGPPIERILFTEEQIDQRIREVAAGISAKYSGRELRLIGVLKRSVYFLTALSRALTVPAKIDFRAISSFTNQKLPPAFTRIAQDLDYSIRCGTWMLGEDII